MAHRKIPPGARCTVALLLALPLRYHRYPNLWRTGQRSGLAWRALPRTGAVVKSD